MPHASVRTPVFARFYARMGQAMERGGMGQHRYSLLAGLTGQVIEVGAGNGLNFPHYPATATRVLAVEPEPTLRRLARNGATDAPVPIEVSDGLAERLPAKDASFDAAVTTLVLCSVADQEAALHEIRRVLRPGGRLYFLEHVQADTPGLARVQRLLDATLWPRLFGGCHTARDTLASIARAGFTIERLDRFRFPDARTPGSFHILGTALRETS
ncbi:class I SAM-dependent methyltransferase [Streptomyces sp. NPDC057611]|uniref:class I SAM-dependent methyltransferase n=1 Tax=Streptomyces sp. NPDC057611 TaxID=3346182 RepID=UPI0036BDE839